MQYLLSNHCASEKWVRLVASEIPGRFLSSAFRAVSPFQAPCEWCCQRHCLDQGLGTRQQEAFGYLLGPSPWRVLSSKCWHPYPGDFPSCVPWGCQQLSLSCTRCSQEAASSKSLPVSTSTGQVSQSRQGVELGTWGVVPGCTRMIFLIGWEGKH